MCMENKQKHGKDKKISVPILNSATRTVAVENATYKPGFIVATCKKPFGII